jgi:hypothetical protein
MKVALHGIIAILLLIVYYPAFSQRDIEPTLVFSDTVNYRFSGEWQYLSTDIYLLNGEKFSALINELDFVRQERERANRRPRRGLSEEYLEYLFITARLKNVRFFGDSDVTYPLYNFQISRDKDQKYHTFVSDNIENIRIIDNLPLYSASDFIDAEINVRAITNNDRDQVLGLIASQLKGLARLQTPTNALLGIIGEFGNFIEANTKKKEYRFSSTIRLFEQKNFDTRLHSVRVYALLTGNSQPVEIKTKALQNLLHTVDNPQITRQQLVELLSYNQYPLIVVANYKSLYRMEQVTGDEINFANIEKRKLKIENDFRAGLINAETYRQERDFINFLTVFANLKNHLEVYSLNYRTGNTDAISGSLFRLLQYYRQLLKTHQEIQFKYRGNSTFKNVFNAEYESILGYASLYLNEDHNLKRLQELVKTLVQLESNPNLSNPADIENAIAALRFADIFRPMQTDHSLEGQLLKMHIEKLEHQLYILLFEKPILELSQTPATSSNRTASDALRGMIRNSSCGVCRVKGLDAVEEFSQRIAEHDLMQALARRDSIVTALQSWMFVQLQRIQLAKINIEQQMVNPDEAQTRGFLQTKIAEAERDINNLQDFSRIDIKGRELQMVETLNNRLLTTQRQAEETINLVCNLRPDVCKRAEQPAVVATPQRVSATKAFAAQDSVVRQNNVFIAIFEHQLGVIRPKIVGNQILMNQFAAANETLQTLKIALDIYGKSMSEPQKLKTLERDMVLLIRELSEQVARLEDTFAQQVK